MAVVNSKSVAITNDDASPIVRNPRHIVRAPSFVAVATIEVAAADDDTSVYRMLRVPSNSVVTGIALFNDAITGGTSYGFGVYDIASNGGAAVSATLFASAVDLSSARVAPLDILFQALDIAKIEQRLWQLLGLSADPAKDYDLAFTSVTNGTAAGTISVRLSFTV